MPRPMMISISIFMAVFLLVGTSGCQSLSTTEKNALYQLHAVGISWEEVKIKDPDKAARYSLLPGGGYYYLNAGTDYPWFFVAAVLNTITWPISILWSMPGARWDATIINKRGLIEYYEYHPAGQALLKERSKYRGEYLGIPSKLDPTLA